MARDFGLSWSDQEANGADVGELELSDLMNAVIYTRDLGQTNN